MLVFAPTALTSMPAALTVELTTLTSMPAAYYCSDTNFENLIKALRIIITKNIDTQRNINKNNVIEQGLVLSFLLTCLLMSINVRIIILLDDLRVIVARVYVTVAKLKDTILANKGPSDIIDTKIAHLRLKFNAFKSLEGEKVNGTFTRLKCLLNDLENNGVIIPQAEVNATFVNSLPRKWLSMNQTQRANNSIKNDCLATLYGKYNYEEGLIDQIYEQETQRFTIQASSSKALISNNHFQDSDSDVEEDQRTSNEFMADLNAEYHERALLANQKRFYKRSGRVGSARKPIDKSKKTYFACGKTGHFQKDCPSNKTSTLSYSSSNNSFKGKYKGIKAKMAILTKRIDDLTKGKSKKGKNEKGKPRALQLPTAYPRPRSLEALPPGPLTPGPSNASSIPRECTQLHFTLGIRLCFLI
ncbi:retrovirus-related pol polyprotein from transposon TNT 1-94 [Tanacetum coccineum]